MGLGAKLVVLRAKLVGLRAKLVGFRAKLVGLGAKLVGLGAVLVGFRAELVGFRAKIPVNAPRMEDPKFKSSGSSERKGLFLPLPSLSSSGVLTFARWMEK